MPTGIYKKSKEHLNKLRTYGFKKGHKSYISKEKYIEIGNKLRGRKLSNETKGKISLSKRGIKLSNEHKYKLSIAKKGKKGILSSGWRGGVSSKNIITRGSIEYRLWRKSIFLKNNFTCQKYGTWGGKLIAHHINNFSEFPELRFSIDNGMTLSEKAHKEFHSLYGIKNNTKEQLEDFLNHKVY